MDNKYPENPKNIIDISKYVKSAILLTGGKGTRFGNIEKALLEFEGKTLLERLVNILFHSVDEIVISVRDKAQKELLEFELRKYSTKYPDRKLRFSFDRLQDAGPLEGIRSGLLETGAEYAFVCACDMPFVNSKVVDLLFAKASGHDAALPVWEDGRFEPLHAVYSKKLILEIEKAFEKGKRSVLTPVFELQDVVHVKMSEIRELDPKLLTFININSLKDMESIFKKTGRK